MRRLEDSIAMFNNLRTLLQDCEEIDIDVKDILKKVDDVIKNISSNEIDIALIGSFSDGKTSALAGIMGEVLRNMKIAIDESSDEIAVYQYKALGKNFRIIDTPGLFGTKEKEVDGKNVRFSELTTKYISEAHIIIYVCDAVNPLKDSHVEAIKYIMCDLKKLPSTIFVINKMDETGYSLIDEEDFNRGKEIKISTLKKRLVETSIIAETEIDSLSIVCIAADPKRKGIEYWLAHNEDYLLRSHISDLKIQLQSMANTCDVEKIKKNVEVASIKDMLKYIDYAIDNAHNNNNSVLNDLEGTREEMNLDMSILRNDLHSSRRMMIDRLDRLQKEIIDKIENSNIKTIGEVLQNDLGVQNDEVSMYKLLRDINVILSDCAECNNSTLNAKSVVIEKRLKEEEEWIKGNISKGAKLLTKINISSKTVKIVRDVIAKGHKFKPYGAVKIASKCNKFLKGAGVAISLFLEVREWLVEYKDIKKFEKLKEELLNAINEIFGDVAERYVTDESFYKNFAPNYIVLVEELDKKNQEISSLRIQLQKYKTLQEKLKSWASDAPYVEFQEIRV